MARFDPDGYPDRFTLDIYVRRLRSEEIARLLAFMTARVAHGFDYALAPASTPISRDTRTGTPARWNSATRS